MKMPVQMNRKRWIWTGIGAAIIILAAFAYYSSSAVSLEGVKAERGEVAVVLEETGYTESVSEYTLESPKSARIVAVYPEIGDAVGIEQDLIVLDNLEADNLTVAVRSEITSIKAQIVAIQEQLEPVNTQIAVSQASLLAEQNNSESMAIEVQKAQDYYDRMQQLYQAGAVSKADYETSQYDLQTAQNRLKTSEDNITGLTQSLDSLNRQKDQIESDIGFMSEQLGIREGDLYDMESELIVYSLSEGRVLELPAEVGQVVAPGMPLIKIGGTGLLQIKADILSDDMAGIKIGQKVQVTAPVLGSQVLYGEVRQIYPSAFEKTSALGVVQRRVSIIISLDETATLKPGYEVTVGVETDRKSDVLRLAREAVRSKADGTYEVMKIVNNKVVVTPVKVGLKNQDWVEIVEGLSEGDIVVKDSSQSLQDGARLRLTNIP